MGGVRDQISEAFSACWKYQNKRKVQQEIKPYIKQQHILGDRLLPCLVTKNVWTRNGIHKSKCWKVPIFSARGIKSYQHSGYRYLIGHLSFPPALFSTPSASFIDVQAHIYHAEAVFSAALLWFHEQKHEQVHKNSHYKRVIWEPDLPERAENKRDVWQKEKG